MPSVVVLKKMKIKFDKYGPLIPVFGIYLVLFLIGKNIEGLWQVAAMLFFYCALGQSFNIFLGMTGYVNFGYVAFMGMGTYGMAVTITGLSETDLGFGIIIIGFLMALLFSTILSLIIGAVALRLREAYFAIATVGVSEGFRYLIDLERFGGHHFYPRNESDPRRHKGQCSDDLLGRYVGTDHCGSGCHRNPSIYEK